MLGFAFLLLGIVPGMASEPPAKFTPIFLEDEIIFATTVATAPPYSADPTGKVDATDAINKALDRVRQLGGGTCYLPSGIYRVEGRIKVPATVTLIGDWSKPEPGKPLDGTILMAFADRGNADGEAFISVSGPKEANMRRLAIWYPEQQPDNIVPYPYTIDGRVSHVREITLLNSYRGIRMTDFSGCVVSDIYGTALETGMETRNSTEFSRIFNVQLTPDFWAKTPAPLDGKTLPEEAFNKVREFVADNLVVVRMGKTDGVSIYEVDATPARGVIDASMTTEEDKWMLTDRSKYGFGGLIWHAPGTRLRTGWDAWYFGAHYGDLDRLPAISKERYNFRATRHPARMDKDSIFDATSARFGAKGDGKSDDTSAIKAALEAAAAGGGGTVYLPQGVYRLTRPIHVPEGVELRGPLATGQVRVWYEPCTLWIDWLPDAGADVFTSPAAVTLAKGAGLRGLTLSHAINIWEVDVGGQLKITPTPFTIRGAGTDTYIHDVTLTNAYLGIDLASHRCDNFLIKDFWATALREGIRVGGGTTGGAIEIATIDFGPWHGWKRLSKDAEKGVRSPYNEYINDNLDTYIFEGCADIDAFSIAGFYPRRHLVFREHAPVDVPKATFWSWLTGREDQTLPPSLNTPENLRFWMPMFDVAGDESVLAQAGDNIDLFGLFVTGGNSGISNWLEFGKNYRGSFRVFAPVVQPIFFNRPLADAPEGFLLDPGTSLTTGLPAKSSSEPEPNHPASNAVDDDPQTFWQSAPQPGATLTVDLGESHPLDRWRIVGHGIFGAARLNTWGATLLISEDGASFTEVDRFTDNTVPVVERPLTPGIRARFVRLRVDQGTSPLGFQRARIYQFDVYASHD